MDRQVKARARVHASCRPMRSVLLALVAERVTGTAGCGAWDVQASRGVWKPQQDRSTGGHARQVTAHRRP